VGRALAKDPADPATSDVSLSLEQNVGDVWIRARASAQSARLVSAAGLSVPEGPKGERLRTFIGHALLDLDVETIQLPSDAGAATAHHEILVTGLPVLHRGMSESVLNNQWNSLWFALILVIGLKALLFRSFWAGVLTSVPTLVTLLAVYGGMGLIGVRLDMGTSMLASLIIGAGDDYAVQYVWSWSVGPKASLESAARAASRENGAGVWINASMVAVGFFVLTLGEARPLQNVGGLTAIAMLVAALATFVICPLLARRRHYAPTPAPPAEEPFVPTEPALAAISGTKPAGS
jgi:predicted RND superfamily exporter protein